jgi:hypothetical protein
MKLTFAALLLVGCAGPSQLDHGPEEPTLEPTGLAFDFLPINSVRGQVTGYDAAADMCVRVIWDFSNHGKYRVGKHCDDFFPGFPYVSIAPGACAPAVAYSGNADLVSATGCVDFGQGGDSPGSVDVTLHVSGPIFTGTIAMKSP